MWATLANIVTWLFRGSQSSATSYVESAGTMHRADFSLVITEWKSLAIELRTEVDGLEKRLDASEAREMVCVRKQYELESRIIMLEWRLKRDSNKDVDQVG